MSLAQAREPFARRYYVWCAVQVRVEVDKDFPILRSVREATALTYLAHAASLPVMERHVHQPSGVLGLGYNPFRVDDGRAAWLSQGSSLLATLG